MFLDLSLLKKKPDTSREVILQIDPLAPLSMVTHLPGSYYKTVKSPSKKMLCGLFENILEWHIDIIDRKKILKEIKKLRKKQGLAFPETDGSTYQPLLMEYFAIQLEILPYQLHFDDYWSRSFRRTDADVHPKGTFNISYEIIADKRELARDEKRPGQVENNALREFFKRRLDRYPFYYSTPTKREFVSTTGNYRIKLLIDPELHKNLEEQLLKRNDAYLGTSEGWVDLKFIRHER